MLGSEQNDIALLRLAKNIKFTSTIQPANLQMDLRDENSNKPLLVTGWSRGTCEFHIIVHLERCQWTKLCPSECLLTLLFTLREIQLNDLYKKNNSFKIQH